VTVRWSGHAARQDGAVILGAGMRFSLTAIEFEPDRSPWPDGATDTAESTTPWPICAAPPGPPATEAPPVAPLALVPMAGVFPLAEPMPVPQGDTLAAILPALLASLAAAPAPTSPPGAPPPGSGDLPYALLRLLVETPPHDDPPHDDPPQGHAGEMPAPVPASELQAPVAELAWAPRDWFF
jgi:hypothetical protein